MTIQQILFCFFLAHTHALRIAAPVPEADFRYERMRIGKMAAKFIKDPVPQHLNEMHPDIEGMMPGHVSVPGMPNTVVTVQCFEPSGDIYVSRSILEKSEWEHDTVTLVANPWLEHPSLKGNFFDMGANIGAYTLPLGHLLQGRGEVISVEAMPVIAEHLKAGIVTNGLSNVNLFQYAVGAPDAQDFITMNLDPINKGGSQINGNKHGDQDFHPGEKVKIGLTTVDMMLEAHPALKSVVSMKADIEGNEGRMLKGANEFFTKYPPCLLTVELNPVWLRIADSSYKEVIETLESYGYGKPPDVFPERFSTYTFVQTDMASCLKRFA